MPGRSFLKSGVLVFLSALLFNIAQPSVFFEQGIPFVAWLALIPFLVVIRHSTYKQSAFWGACYAVVAYGLFAAWLRSYSPFALVAVCVCYGLFFAVTAFFLCAVSRRFLRAGWVLQACVLLLFEFLRSKGDFGFHYGIIGYSQWRVPFLIHTAYLGGVWALSACIYLFETLCAAMLSQRSCMAYRMPLLVLLVCEAGYVIAGNCIRPMTAFTSEADSKKLSVVLIQPNDNPWKNDMEAYYESFAQLSMLTDEALSAHPQTELVVWPETAFVPDIMYHYYYAEDAAAHALVLRLIEYMEKKSCAFVVGNNYMDAEGCYYNSVLYFEPGRNVLPPRPEIYSKRRLVPVSEYAPRFVSFLVPYWEKTGVQFFTPGKNGTVFNCNGIPFVTPVCFEDTFPEQVRDMVLQGGRLIVNLSNDSWSNSRACQYQHLSMAAFRSAENAVPTVRSTASGETCVIDARGKVIASAPAFRACYVYAEIDFPLE